MRWVDKERKREINEDGDAWNTIIRKTVIP